MAERNTLINYKFNIGEKDFDYNESFESYSFENLLQITSGDQKLNGIFKNEKFRENSTEKSYSDINENDTFDYISQFNLLYCTYKKYNSENISKIYKATKKVRELIYEEKFYISLLNNYEYLDQVETEIPFEFQGIFKDFFTSLVEFFENKSITLENVITRINISKYPEDFGNCLNSINGILDEAIKNNNDDNNYKIYRKIDHELFAYVKSKPTLLSKVIYSKKVINHLTTTKSYVNKYMAAICGTNSVPQNNKNSYKYLLDKIQNRISDVLSALNISTDPSSAITSLLDKKARRNILDLFDKKAQEAVCVAFLIDSEQNYYSFNGNDYTEVVYPVLREKFEEILQGENFLYAQQCDDTRSFYLKKEEDKPVWRDCNLVGNGKVYITYSENKDEKIFTCCERKILSKFGYKDLHEYHFLIALRPCCNCKRAFNYTVSKHNAKFDIQCFDKNDGLIKMSQF